MSPYACVHFRLAHMFPPPRGAPVAAAMLAALAVLLWLLPAPVAAHGFLADPAARNYKRDWKSRPHCANFGGTWPSSGEGRLAWPRTAQPACGEHELMRAGDAVATYTEGDAIDVSVFITAQHGGRHAFRLCPDAGASERCLAQHLLQRTDGSGPYSWTPTDGGPAPGSRFSKGSLAGQGGELYTWRYRLPPGVSCARCVLQWWWTTANSCRVPGAPAWVGSDPGMLPCTNGHSPPEEFRNCADITIESKGNSKAGGAGGAAAVAAQAAQPAGSSGGKARTSSGTTAPKQPLPHQQQQQQQQQKPAQAAQGSIASNIVPIVHGGQRQQQLKPRAAVTQRSTAATNKRSAAQPGDACKAAGRGLHVLPLGCDKFLVCAGGEGWTLHCPKGTVWDGSRQACAAGQCAGAGMTE